LWRRSLLRRTQAANIVSDEFAQHKELLKYRVITLQEPPKKVMVAFLDREHSGEQILERPPRVAMVQLINFGAQNDPYQLFEVLVNLNEGIIVEKRHLKGKHSFIDAEYMKDVEKACMADTRVQEEISTLDLPDGATVCVEPWAYATDGMNDMTRRITMVRFLRSLCPRKSADSLTVLVLHASWEPSGRKLLCLPA
jgi:primary-amine oxidase